MDEFIMPKKICVFTEKHYDEIINAYKKSKNVWEQKRLLCIKLKIENNMKSEEIAKIVGYTSATVRKLMINYYNNRLSILLWKKKIGNKRNLTLEEEREVLKPFLESADQGKMLIVTDIKKSYEEKVGREVPKSTIYRMLNSQGWRKIMPRSKHPKSKPEEFDAYKKNF